jgi:hypothetical protein
MAGESSVTVGGKLLHLWDRVVGASTVSDEFVLPGEYPYPSYTVTTDGGVALATANSHLLQVMAGASNHLRVRRITISALGVPAAVTAMEIQIVRIITTAGTGGTVKTPRRMVSADAAAGATAMTLPTVKGTEGDIWLSRGVIWGTAALPLPKPEFDWVQQPNEEPFLIAAGITNGFVIKNITGVATATVVVSVELVETAFV